MPSAVADFPDRAPPSTSTRRPARPLAGRVGAGVAVSKLADGAVSGGVAGSKRADGAVSGGVAVSKLADGAVSGGVAVSKLAGESPGDDGAPGDKRSTVASCATSPITTTAGLVTPAESTVP